MFPLRIAFDGLNGSEDEVSADLDVLQLVFPGSEGGVQKGRKAQIGGIVHPVAAFDQPDRFFGRAELLLIFTADTHTASYPAR